MTDATIATLATPDGPFTVLEDGQGRVLASGWTTDAAAIAERLPIRHRPATVTAGRLRSTEAVEAYYAGELAAIDEVAVHQLGTPLQLAVWRELRAIAPGHPLTYTELADRAGSPRAVRGAASACARNAPALFVPCHRVVASGGALAGFAWGLEVKRSLLAREG